MSQNSATTILAGSAEAAAVLHDGARLTALRELGLLNAPAEDSFARLSRLATATLGTPVSLVSLIDDERQFLLGQHGLRADSAVRELPLTASFCQHVVSTRMPLVIVDAREDELMAASPAVTQLGAVAYAGMPLILQDGYAVGALCAIDSQPRAWTEAELAILADLAAEARELLDLRRAIARESLYDRLTGLPNRALLVAHAGQFLARRDAPGRLVVMCAGLDNFTQINQALGTDHADAVLTAAGRRLSESLRAGDVLGRLRGDMFTILADGVRDETGALMLAARMRDALARAPLEIGDERLSISATIGIAISQSESRAADLVSEAANAMRQAKRHHSRTRIAQKDWTTQAVAQLRLHEALRGALERDEIHAVYQPIVDLETGTVRSYETLARWTHRELGPVSPVDFIPAAESTGEIGPIGRWILECACMQLAHWRDTVSPELNITVNVAPLQLAEPDLVDTVAQILRRAGLPGTALVLEITEGVLLENAATQTGNLRRLRELGIRIALDDFGTGYSALGYLKRFPIDIIKIDRSFITGIEDRRYDTALIQAILAMANGMDMLIVAEGIETPNQRQLLRLLGCHLGQGYLFARPMPAGEVAPAVAL